MAHVVACLRQIIFKTEWNRKKSPSWVDVKESPNLVTVVGVNGLVATLVMWLWMKLMGSELLPTRYSHVKLVLITTNTSLTVVVSLVFLFWSNCPFPFHSGIDAHIVLSVFGNFKVFLPFDKENMKALKHENMWP